MSKFKMSDAFTQGGQEVAVAAYGKLWQSKPANYIPRSRNGVYQQMNELVMGTAKA